MRPMAALCPLILLSLFLYACAAEKTTPPVAAEQALTLVPPKDWPLMADDMSLESLEQAAAYSLAYMQSRPQGALFTYGPKRFYAADLARGFTRALELRRAHPEAQAFTMALKQEFDLYQAIGGANGSVLFTGYYEPVLPGRLNPEPGFEVPLYALPSDLLTVSLQDFDANLPNSRLVGRAENNKLVPYHTREDIDFKGAIKDKAKILAYVSDPVEAFFMHVQGSGQIELADGGLIRLGYAGVNGRPYRSIGRLLLEMGAMEPERISMQDIQKYLAENPQNLRQVLCHNPSYVFFRPLSAEGGPIGSYNSPVSAGRSIACDRALFPPMALAFIVGTTPTANGGQSAFSRLVWAQDTGGAIKGPGRLDLFYGSGAHAGMLAGRMKNHGQLYFLAPKGP